MYSVCIGWHDSRHVCRMVSQRMSMLAYLKMKELTGTDPMVFLVSAVMGEFAIKRNGPDFDIDPHCLAVDVREGRDYVSTLPDDMGMKWNDSDAYPMASVVEYDNADSLLCKSTEEVIKDLKSKEERADSMHSSLPFGFSSADGVHGLQVYMTPKKNS